MFANNSISTDAKDVHLDLASFVHVVLPKLCILILGGTRTKNMCFLHEKRINVSTVLRISCERPFFAFSGTAVVLASCAAMAAAGSVKLAAFEAL